MQDAFLSIDLYRYMKVHGTFEVDRAVEIARDVALELAAFHRQGIVHRDVKPQNIVLRRDGTTGLLGLVIRYDNFHYHAPEQVQSEVISQAVDVYALGCVMYEMLTGQVPFDGNNPTAVAIQHIHDKPVPPSKFNPNIPPALEEIILRCLEKVPEMRFRDGSQLARALETLAAN